MPAPEQVLYAMPAMRALSRAEAAAMAARIPGRAGSYGLRLGMHDGIGECPDAIAHWVRLCRHGPVWTGDLRARCDEPLPFANDTFALVWLSQALQFQSGERICCARPCGSPRPADCWPSAACIRSVHGRPG